MRIIERLADFPVRQIKYTRPRVLVGGNNPDLVGIEPTPTPVKRAIDFIDNGLTLSDKAAKRVDRRDIRLMQDKRFINDPQIQAGSRDYLLVRMKEDTRSRVYLVPDPAA